MKLLHSTHLLKSGVDLALMQQFGDVQLCLVRVGRSWNWRGSSGAQSHLEVFRQRCLLTV